MLRNVSNHITINYLSAQERPSDSLLRPSWTAARSHACVSSVMVKEVKEV